MIRRIHKQKTCFDTYYIAIQDRILIQCYTIQKGDIKHKNTMRISIVQFNTMNYNTV